MRVRMLSCMWSFRMVPLIIAIVRQRCSSRAEWPNDRNSSEVLLSDSAMRRAARPPNIWLSTWLRKWAALLAEDPAAMRRRLAPITSGSARCPMRSPGRGPRMTARNMAV